MSKNCQKNECTWPECAHNCGRVPEEDYIVGSCPEEALIHYLQEEVHRWRMTALKYAQGLQQISKEIEELSN